METLRKKRLIAGGMSGLAGAATMWLGMEVTQMTQSGSTEEICNIIAKNSQNFTPDERTRLCVNNLVKSCLQDTLCKEPKKIAPHPTTGRVSSHEFSD